MPNPDVLISKVLSEKEEMDKGIILGFDKLQNKQENKNNSKERKIRV